MQKGSVSSTIYWLNMLANNMEPSPIVEGCIFEYGCEHHLRKSIKAMIKNIRANRQMLEKQVEQQRKEIENFNYYEELQAAGKFFGVNYMNVFEQNYEAIIEERRREALKEAEFIAGRVDIDSVWQTEQPVMFGFLPVEERRLSFTKNDISFNEEEFTNGAEIKKMITTLID